MNRVWEENRPMQPNVPADLHVAVLAGGASSERTVSISSGSQVFEALQSLGYRVELIDTLDAKAAVRRLLDEPYDVVFLALHGKGGEDGLIQGVCETLGIPYTGSGVLASALAMDKGRAKTFYRSCGIPVAASVSISCGESWSVDAVAEAIGFPCVVKPVDDGSSLGMSIVREAAELPQAVEEVMGRGQDVLVEAFVDGVEITVPVLGNDDPEVLPVIEIVPHDAFYSYEVKYVANGADHIIPARLDPEVYARAQEYAVRAHKALGCAGESRSDFIVTKEGVPVILETNTIPGMTQTSLLPDAARVAGYSFPEVCARLIGYALERFA